MTNYIVIAIYADNHQRYATTIQASSPREAELRAIEQAEAELIIAAVLDENGDIVA
jgi:hypothetical protein